MTWRKSTASAETGCCVWVEIQPDIVLVQGDTGPVLRFTHTEWAALRFTHTEWAAFLAGVRAGEFDIEETHG